MDGRMTLAKPVARRLGADASGWVSEQLKRTYNGVAKDDSWGFAA